MSSNPYTAIQRCLDLLRANDPRARDELIAVSKVRLVLMTHTMLHQFPRVRRWEQTDDVFQNVCVRLETALREAPAATPTEFLQMAAAQIRWELLDLARHYFGPKGLGSHHVTPTEVPRDCHPEQVAAESDEPDSSSSIPWPELHEWIGGLPEETRAVFDLVWYHDMTQDEAAKCLGTSLRSVKRRWQQARVLLGEWLGKSVPIDLKKKR